MTADDSKKLFVPKKSCDTCPYLRATPSGVWDVSEYEKLRAMDNREWGGAGNTIFHCHQENATGVPTACRGWLWTHGGNTGVRLAVMGGLVKGDELPQEDEAHLYYETGQEAYEFGVKDIDAPSAEACKKIHRLVKKGAGFDLPKDDE